jgi:WbqC-like protein
MTTRTGCIADDMHAARTIADVRREGSGGLALGIMQPCVFPYLGYFQLMAAVDRFVVYDDVAFIKQGWIIRNILVDGAPHRFTIPLHDPSSFRAINETMVNRSGYAPFVRKFLRTIDQSHHHAAWVSPARALLADVLEGFEGSVGRLAVRSLRAVARYVGIGTVVESPHTYGSGRLKAQERGVDTRARDRARTHVNAIGGRAQYATAAFGERGIELRFVQPRAVQHAQFGATFVPNLSVVGVLMFNASDRVRALLGECDLL